MTGRLLLPTSIAAARMAFSIALNKLAVLLLGPSGLLLLGAFQNHLQLTSRACNLGVETGITARIVDNRSDGLSVVATSILILIAGTLLTWSSLLISYYAGYDMVPVISGGDTNERRYAFVALAIFAPLVGLAVNAGAALNGTSKIRLYTVAMTGSIVLSGGLLILLARSPSNGAVLIIWGCSQCSMLLWMLCPATKVYWGRVIQTARSISLRSIKALTSYSKMTAVSVISTAALTLALRAIVIDSMSTAEAGSWQALVKITEALNGALFVGCNFYLVPKFVEANSVGKILHACIVPAGLVGVCYLMGISFSMFFSDVIFEILYARELSPGPAILASHLLGGLIQMYAWFIGLIFVVKNQLSYHFSSQIFTTMGIYVLAYYITPRYGLNGAISAGVGGAILLLFCNGLLLRRYFKRINDVKGLLDI